MCTGFVKKGSDVIFGYNLDIDPNVWDFKLVKNSELFTVAIKVGSITYYTHGVNKNGQFGCLPYMNDDSPFVKLRGAERVDILVDRYIRGKLNYESLMKIFATKEVSNVKFGSMHAMFATGSGDAVICEPGCGVKAIENDFGVIANFPLLKCVEGDNPFYGKDRFKVAEDILSRRGSEFSCHDGLSLLKAVCQEGQWATRLSFVYSAKENCVHYVVNNNFDCVQKHQFNVGALRVKDNKINRRTT